MVVAMGLAALMVAVSGTARTSGYLRDKSLAQWMALNRLAEVRLNLSKFGQNTDTGELKFANRTWHYDTRYFDTSIPTMKRVVVRVYAGDAKTKGNPLAESTGFLGSALAAAGSSNLDWTVGSVMSTAGRAPGDSSTGNARHRVAARNFACHGAADRAGTHPHHAALSMRIKVTLASRQRLRGFTLIEILVALLILGIMSALGYGTYRAARISAERTEDSLQRSREIEFGMRIMVSDLAENVPRPVRDMMGQTRLPALRGTGGFGTLSNAGSASGSTLGSGSTMNFASQSFKSQSFNSGSGLASSTTSTVTPIVDLTRAGWSNTAGQQRSTLQRVSYTLVDDVIKRSYLIILDTVQGNAPVVQDLFTKVKAIQLRYLDGNQTWQTQWPPPTLGQPDSLWTRPVAVELIIEFKDWGQIRRLIEVAG